MSDNTLKFPPVDFEALCNRLAPLRPNPFQRDTIVHFLDQPKNDTVDVILTAPTGSGKGFLFAMMAEARPDVAQIFVVIIPLRGLQVVGAKVGEASVFLSHLMSGIKSMRHTSPKTTERKLILRHQSRQIPLSLLITRNGGY